MDGDWWEALVLVLLLMASLAFIAAVLW